MRISDWSSDVCSSDLRVAVSATAFPATAGGEQQGEEGKGDDEAHPHGQQPFAIEPTPVLNRPFAERLRKSGEFTPCRGGDQAVSLTFSKSSSFPSASRAIRLSVDRLTSRPFAPSPVSSSIVNATRVRSGASSSKVNLRPVRSAPSSTL